MVARIWFNGVAWQSRHGERKQVMASEPSVTLRVQLPSDMSVTLGDKQYAIDIKKLAENPEALRHVVEYGIGRFTRDGTTKLTVGEGDAKVTRDATPEERVTLASEKWDRLFTGRLRERVAGSGDPVLAELRTLAVRFLVKAGTSRKAIPKLPDRDAVKAALKAHSGVYGKLVKRAEAIAELKAEEL